MPVGDASHTLRRYNAQHALYACMHGTVRSASTSHERQQHSAVQASCCTHRRINVNKEGRWGVGGGEFTRRRPSSQLFYSAIGPISEKNRMPAVGCGTRGTAWDGCARRTRELGRAASFRAPWGENKYKKPPTRPNGSWFCHWGF